MEFFFAPSREIERSTVHTTHTCVHDMSRLRERFLQTPLFSVARLVFPLGTCTHFRRTGATNTRDSTRTERESIFFHCITRGVGSRDDILYICELRQNSKSHTMLFLSFSLFADVSIAVNISPKYIDYTHAAIVIRQIDEQESNMYCRLQRIKKKEKEEKTNI